MIFRKKKHDDVITEIKRRRKEKRAMTSEKIRQQLVNNLMTTTKQLIWFYTINGTIWIYCSYVLAFQGRDQIAESLSSHVCTVIMGSIGFYLVSKTVENVFRYNDGLFGKSSYSEDVSPDSSTPVDTPAEPEIPVTPDVPEEPEPVVDPTSLV